MASKKTTTKTIRIANETAEYFEGKALNRAVEGLHGLIESGKLSFDGEAVKINGECTHHDNPLLDEITGMLKLCGVTEVRFFERVCEMLDEGELLLTNGSVEVAKPEGLERFEAVCHERCLDPESVLDKATKAVERGTL